VPEHRQDPQDKQFGAQASRDADLVDDLAGRGAEVSDESRTAPRAGDKAEPVVDDGPGPMRACSVHEDHGHAHGEGCGHEAVEHEGHLDYLHGGHRHAAHAGHWDDH
jgi:hypothetical protein